MSMWEPQNQEPRYSGSDFIWWWINFISRAILVFMLLSAFDKWLHKTPKGKFFGFLRLLAWIALALGILSAGQLMLFGHFGSS